MAFFGFSLLSCHFWPFTGVLRKIFGSLTRKVSETFEQPLLRRLRRDRLNGCHGLGLSEQPCRLLCNKMQAARLFDFAQGGLCRYRITSALTRRPAFTEATAWLEDESITLGQAN